MSENKAKLQSAFSVWDSAGDPAQAQVTPVVLRWDTEIFDLLDEMLVVAPWTFTPRRAGYYYFYAQASIVHAPPIDGLLNLRVNGVVVAQAWEDSSFGGAVMPKISHLIYLTPNDVVDVQWLWNGGAPNLAGVNNSQLTTYFIGFRVF